ncbi:MAG: DUF4231 domain-containing protein, partial [Planctomycetia bacterium]|nr:DUF4231 domain-containing protein [Planctomycetia bacterium]
EVPILVCDGLAEGADQLVAEVVAELRQLPATRCLKLVAVTPMPLAFYREDFDTSESLSALETRLAEADARVELALTKENQALLEANPKAEIDRTPQYERLGKYLANSVFLLLALWDGEDLDAPTPGGTADVVRMKLDGCENVQYTLGQTQTFWAEKAPWESIQPFGGVFQIVTPRRNSAAQDSAGKTESWFSTDVQDATKIQEVYRHQHKPMTAEQFLMETSMERPIELLGEANRDAMKFYPQSEKAREKSRKYLLGDFRPAKSGNLEFITRYYTIFDVLAQKYQSYFNKMAAIYICLGVLFALLFYVECFVKSSLMEFSTFEFCLDSCKWNWDGEWTWWRVGVDATYFLVLAVLIAVYVLYKKRPYYERYHRYRALAEALRVQIFWQTSGVTERVMDNYHYHPIGSLDWLRNTVNTIVIPLTPSSDFTEDHRDLKFVYERWILDQRAFFFSRIGEMKKASDRWSGWCMCFTYLAVGWLFVRIGTNRVSLDPAWLHWVYCLGAVALASCGALAVACYLHNRFRCYDSQKNRYDKIFPIFHAYSLALEKRLAQNQEIDTQTRKELHKIGTYALTENADWFLTQRKLELPK